MAFKAYGGKKEGTSLNEGDDVTLLETDWSMPDPWIHFVSVKS